MFDPELWAGRAQEIAVNWGPTVLGAITLFVVGLMVAKIVRAAVRRAMERAGMDETLQPFLAGIVYYVLLAALVTAVLGLFGIPTTSVVALLGAAGLAVGLALQGTLSNFASGVMLLVFRPFKVGDFVEVAGQSGTVQEIRIFTTRLDTADNVGITIPNSSVWGDTIVNYAANDTRRIDLVIGVGYGDNLGTALATLRDVVGSDDRVLESPEPVVAVHELGDSSVNFVVRPWCERADYWALRWDLTRACKERLEAAGCEIPFPQTDVHLYPEEKAS